MWNYYLFFFCKQKTAYEMRISAWSSDVFSSDLNLFPPAYTAPSNFVSIQKSFTQEARLQSADPEAALSWTIGGFYQNSRQHTEQSIVAPLFPDFMLGFGVPVDLFFAPGGMLPNGVLYASNDSAKDTQLAAFGQIDWKATDRLTLTLGGRVSRTKFSLDNFQDGEEPE